MLPILTTDDPGRAVGAVAALAAGGLGTVEITLRTARAWEVIECVVRDVPQAVVGVGTVTDGDDLLRAEDAGARFAVSPGLVESVVRATRRSRLPLLPGVATVTEALAASGAGFDTLKLFPAAALGGTTFLDAVAGPLPDLVFCPTGGVGAESWIDYLSRPNVVAVGGSWMVAREALASGDDGTLTSAAAAITGRLRELAA